MDKLIITKEMSLHIKENRPFRLAFPSDGEPSVGDVYRARVQRVNPALKNAFLELGDGKRAYMNLGEEPLRPGQELTVMISQEGMKEKLPTAARELTFPGEWLVLTSDPGFLGFSRRASFDGPAREEIHAALSPWFETCGFILRTASEQATLDQLTQEAALLAEAFGNLLRRAEHSPAPCCLLKGSPVYLEWLQGLDKRELQVITDEEELYEELRAYYASRKLPAEGLRFYRDESISLTALYGLEKAKREAKERKIWLKSGAYLILEQTEAMTVIDVNSGKEEDTGKGTIWRINEEAAREVARQLILRNLSGMILVDFINMKKPEDNERLLALLREAVRPDPVFTQVVDMTPLGLVEITRRRIRRPV